MKLQKLIAPLVTVTVVGGIGIAAYTTRQTWLPHVFPAPAAQKPDEHDHGDEHHHEASDRVTLSEQAQRNLQLDVGTLTPREYWRTILIPGVITDRPGESDRGVPSRVAGIITDIRARPGDTVRPGDPLFTLQLVSELIQSTQTELAKAATDLEFAIAERDRIARLVAAGTTAGSELTRQQSQVDRLTTQVSGYRRQLQLFGFTPEQVARAERGEVIAELVVSAPGRPAGLAALIGGQADLNNQPIYEVKSLQLTLGDQVQPGQTLCILADHSRLFVEGWAFKSEAKLLGIAAEERVPIRAEFADENPGDWSPVEPLVIHHFANQVHPISRTFAFYLPLENQSMPFVRDGRTFVNWRFRVGQRVRLRVPIEKLTTPGADGRSEALPFVLPAEAVVREGPEAFVFVQLGDVFVRKPVRVLYEDRTDAVIANDGGITRADLVVKNQAAALNRALKLATAGGGGDHHHDH